MLLASWLSGVSKYLLLLELLTTCFDEKRTPNFHKSPIKFYRDSFVEMLLKSWCPIVLCMCSLLPELLTTCFDEKRTPNFHEFFNQSRFVGICLWRCYWNPNAQLCWVCTRFYRSRGRGYDDYHLQSRLYPRRGFTANHNLQGQSDVDQFSLC